MEQPGPAGNTGRAERTGKRAERNDRGRGRTQVVSSSAGRFQRSLLVDSLVRALFGWDEEPDQAARRVAGLLRGATPSEVLCLEADYRSRRYGIASFGLGALLDGRALSGAGPAEHRPALAALLSFDRSGYAREAGVAELAEAPGAFPVPFLLLRLNDPVTEVRDLAQQALAPRLTAEHVPFLVEALPLLDHLGRRRRAGPLLTVVADLLDRGGTEALWRGAGSEDPALRACCLRWLARVDPVAAIRTAFATRDPALWRWAARVATSARLTSAEQDALLPCLEESSSPRIRLRALRARARQPHGEGALRRAMLDRDARVRYHARATLYARGLTDLAPQVYRDALAADPPPEAVAIGALGGLADLGAACDVPRVRAFTTHRTACVRAEAWRTLSVLDPQAVAREAARLAADPSRKVRRYLPDGAQPGDG